MLAGGSSTQWNGREALVMPLMLHAICIDKKTPTNTTYLPSLSASCGGDRQLLDGLDGLDGN